MPAAWRWLADGGEVSKAATNIPSACKIANIALKDAMILPYDANPDRTEFSERTSALRLLAPRTTPYRGRPKHWFHGYSSPCAGWRVHLYWFETRAITLMETYKRNQFLEAASATLGQGSNPTAALKTDAKRLLDTDRALDRSPRSRDPERANYAFFSGEAPGRGVEVLFSPYEAFALRLGLDLLRHGWPQATAVKILRHVRPHLEPKYAKILRWNPAELFDQKKEAARSGDLAFPTTRPVHLVIASSMGRRRTSDETREVAVLENDELMPFLLREAGRSSTVIEVTRLAHDLQSALAKTTPSKRGKASA